MPSKIFFQILYILFTSPLKGKVKENILEELKPNTVARCFCNLRSATAVVHMCMSALLLPEFQASFHTREGQSEKTTAFKQTKAINTASASFSCIDLLAIQTEVLCFDNSCYHDWVVWFSEGKALSDDDVLEDLPVGTTATMFFQDLGPQIGWTMVKNLAIWCSFKQDELICSV